MAGGARGLSHLSLEEDGAEHHPGAARSMLEPLRALYGSAVAGPGHRLRELGSLAPFLSHGSAVHSLVERHIGAGTRPVRAIAFDKSPEVNWALGWHQDRTICVRDHHDVPGYGPWTSKQGLHHVEPPFAIIEQMVTARIHLDPVGNDNAPLRFVRGSHRLGLIPESAIDLHVEAGDELVSLAKAGDVWLYSTPVLHASDRATSGKSRRVLQVDFSASELPTPLQWLLG